MSYLYINRDQFEEQLAFVEANVKNREVGLFGPDSMMWRLSRHALFGAHGAGRALLLQIAHPWITQGVDHHSKTRSDPLGRAARTFTAVLSIVYGNMDQAARQARIVHNVHTRIQGTMDNSVGAFAAGSHYQANEAHAMLWVHATLWETTILMYELFKHPLSADEKERFYQETKLFAYMFGIPNHILPPNWPEFMEYNRRMWASDQLTVDASTLELTGFLFAPLHVALTPAMAWLRIATAATLPERLREAFGLRYGKTERILFASGRKMIQLAEPVAPAIVRNGPTYIEATRRIGGRPSTWMTRTLTKSFFGVPELVALKRSEPAKSRA